MTEKYEVIYPIKDEKDKNLKEYAIGDEYTGSKDKERLAELLSSKNKAGTPVIRKKSAVAKGDSKDDGK